MAVKLKSNLYVGKLIIFPNFVLYIDTRSFKSETFNKIWKDVYFMRDEIMCYGIKVC